MDLKSNYIFADKFGGSESELSDINKKHKVASFSGLFLGINLLF